VAAGDELSLPHAAKSARARAPASTVRERRSGFVIGDLRVDRPIMD
jgi:hypothetical protein